MHRNEFVPIAATIMGPSGTVSEADGEVDVCVNVTNASNIPDGGAEVEVIVSTGTATRKLLTELSLIHI